MGHAFSSSSCLSWRSIALISDTFWQASSHHDLTVSREFIIRQFFETRGAMGAAGAKPLAPVEDPLSIKSCFSCSSLEKLLACCDAELDPCLLA